MEPGQFSEGDLSAIDGADARHGLRLAVHELRIGPCGLATLTRDVDKVSSGRFALEVHQVYRPRVVNNGPGQTATVGDPPQDHALAGPSRCASPASGEHGGDHEHVAD